MTGTPPYVAPDATAEPRELSNAEKSALNHARLQAWLDGADKIPERNGAANVSLICELAGVDRQMVYTSKRAKRLIEGAVTRVGLGMPNQQRAAPGGETVPAWAKQRITELEEALTVAKAEARDLRARLRRYEHLDQHVAETGMLPR